MIDRAAPVSHQLSVVVHDLSAGRIVKSGEAGLAKELEARGYDWVVNA